MPTTIRSLILVAWCCLAWLLPQAPCAATIDHPAPLADPVAVGHDEMVFLFNMGSELRVERRHWASGKVTTFPLPSPPRDAKGQLPPHVVAVNGSGIWVVGHTVSLVRPDGKLAQVDFPVPTTTRGLTAYEEGGQDIAIGLDDGDLLLLRKVRGETRGAAFRIRRQGLDRLAIQRIEGTPPFNHGAAATRLRDGRVLVLAGYESADKAWLFDPSGDRWAQTGSTRLGRMHGALAATADGGAFVAGSGWQVQGNAAGSREEASHAAEIWNPRSGQWSPLPPLPLSLRVTTYLAERPSAAVLPDGSLLVAGGMHPHVLLLRGRQGRHAQGWQVAVSLSKPRMGGIVQALGDQELVVSRGAQPTEDGRCCRYATGTERVAWRGDGEQRTSSVGVARRDAALAQRAGRVFVAGGWESFHFSFGAIQASAVAELMDIGAGTVQALPPLPHPMFTGKAEWLDDDHIVVKATARSALYEQPFYGMDGRSLEFDSRGFLTVLDLKRNTWTTLEDDRLARAELAGVVRGSAVLIHPDGAAWLVHPTNWQLRDLPPAIFARRGGTLRVLADGRIVVAGGEAQSDSIQAVDADCQGGACKERPYGTGPLTPARRFEVLREGQWEASALSRAGSTSAIVRADGRVMALGWIEPRATTKTPQLGRWLIEESNLSGSQWHVLPLPEGLSSTEGAPGSSCGRSAPEAVCRLLLVEHPAMASGAVFLLRAGTNGALQDVWHWGGDASGWGPVVSRSRTKAGAPIAEDRVPLLVLGDRTLYGAGLLSARARYWVE
jgi:hypothetical protein